MKKLINQFSMQFCMLVIIGFFAFLQSANAQLTNYGFETGNFTGWSASSGTSISTIVSYNNWTVNPADSYMATIDPNSNLYRGTVESTLGLQPGSLVASNASLFNSSTNFATLNQQFVLLAANQTVSIYWNFIARDYAPFNDGAIATLVGPSYQQIKLLAVTANAYGDAAAVVTGSYGSAGWHKVTFTSGVAGTYKLGFASFNTGDQILSPILIIDNAPGGNFQPGQPIIVTTAVSSVGTTSAVSGGNITSDGGAPVTARGVVWNTTGLPTITDPHTSDGTGLGSFTSNVAGLSPGTAYYLRSYAVNSAGTVYGGQITFTTVNPIPADPSSITVSANPICNGTSTQLTANGIVGTVNWYTGSCGGTLVGSGNSITVSPGVTTTYYARNFSNNLYSNGCASATVTVNSAPTISCPSNITVSNTPGQCGANVTFPAATVTGLPAPTITYSQPSGGSFPMGTTAVTATATNSCGTVTCTFNVTVTGIDTDGDGIPDDCDDDADNDGIPNSAECTQSNFYWSNPPTVSGNTATGTINGIGYTYTSSSPVTTTTNMYAHSNFPASYNVPNSNPTIQNIYVTNNTLTFASPMKNPVLVFASIGQAGLSVPISFSAPVQVVWSQNVVVNSPTQITGTEGYAIVRLMGTFTSVSFNYLKAENYCNFAFGADFMTCGDTDGDGIPDYLDTDSDNDGCPDAIEGSMHFALSQTQNGRLVGAVDSHGIPVIAGAGQGIGTSKSYNANCSCQPEIDKTPPVALTQNVTVQLDGSGNGSTTAALVNNGSSDACGIKTLALSKTAFTCSDIATNPNVVTLTVTDNNGNVSTATANVTVVDAVAPVALAKNVTVLLDASGNGSTTADLVNNGSSDACGIKTLALSKTAFTCSDIATNPNVVTLTVTDNHGNVSTATANVTVVDAVAPVAVAQNVTVQLDATGNGSTTAALVNNGSSDACGIKTLALSKTAFTCSDIATNPNVVTLTVTDNNGNVSTATATVTVVDAVAPVAVAQNVTVQLDANGNGSTTAALVNNGSSDACGIKSLALSKTAFTCSDIATNPNVVTLTVTDNHGNVSTATANVTVVDAVPPVAVAQNVTVQLDASGNGSTTAALVNNGSSDACGIKSLALSKTAFTCSDIATNPNVVTLTVTDNNGNVSTATATVTVQDKVAPTLTVPVNIVKLNDPGVCGATVNIGQATATDNCGVATITNNAPAFFPVGITTVTWTAVDVNGNSTKGTQTVEITNNAPVISGLTVSPLLQLGVTTLASATHADNNLVAATWNWGDGLSTPGTIVGSQLSGNHVYSQTGLFNVTLTIEDACGKSDTKTYSYVVIYNPCNGFVTGGGNFTTPKGAYSANTSLTGKSNYGFEVKYEEGKKVPEGEFEFQFSAAKFEMEATTFDWLMVNGDMAVMKGNAKVNDKVGYHFIASVVDGKTPSKNGTDYLRLIVWDNAGNVLYDNQIGDPDYARALTPISNGQIVIHKYKHENCFGDDFDNKDEMSHDIIKDDENSSQIGNDNASNNENKSDNSPKTPILVEMTVYPNPLVNHREVDITIKNFGNTVAKVELAYINGRVVYSTPKVEFSGGKAKIDFSKAKLTPGNYLITVSENGTMRVGVKQIIVL